MMAIIGTIVMTIGYIKNWNSVIILGGLLMSAGYLGMVLDNLQRKQAELIKGIIDNLRK